MICLGRANPFAFISASGVSAAEIGNASGRFSPSVCRASLLPRRERPSADVRCFVGLGMDLTPVGVWHFYDGRAGMEPRIGELREDFALRKIPTASFAANALYLEIIRLAYNPVTAFQRNCLEESWHNLTLQKLRYKLFLLPGELTRPQNRPILRLRESPILQDLAHEILRKTHRLKPLHS